MDTYSSFAIILIASAVAGLVATRLRQPLIAAYIVVGIAAGPAGMHDLANLAEAGLEHTVRGRVRDHQSGQRRDVLPGLVSQIGEIHVTVLVTFDDDDFQARHLCRCRVRAMSAVPACRIPG